jgi:anti-anti-sigma factor
MSEPPAAIEATPIGDNIVIRVTGELDVFNATDMTNDIEAAIPTRAHGAVIDLTGVGFLDSTAIRNFFSLAARLAERRQRLKIVTPEGSTVRRTLQLVEFSRAAPVHATLEDALESLSDDDAGAPTAGA